MARPKKNNADFFSHDADMRNNVRIKALRRKYSHTGYAVWCYMLEVLTDSDHFEIQWNELTQELLSGDFDVSPDQLREVVGYCTLLGLLTPTPQGFLTSETLKERFAPLLQKRKRDNSGVFGGENSQEPRDPEIIADEKPHSIVKYSKVKESIDTHTQDINIPDVNTSTRAREFLGWLKDHYPAVQQMPEPFTAEQADRIQARYTTEDIKRLIMAMDNKGAPARNKSAYSTFCAFASNDKLIRERLEQRGKLYTYGEMTDMVTSHKCAPQDFVSVIKRGRRFWQKITDTATFTPIR